MEGVYGEKFFRNLGAITKREQKKINCACFAVIGLGGLGGIALETLARAGAARFILFDHDRIELSNFNRQILATDGNIDVLKVEAAKKRVLGINSAATVTAHWERFSRASAKKISKADFVIDASDNIATRLVVSEACKANGNTHVFCSANDGKGIVTVFDKKAKADFEKMFQINRKNVSKYAACQSIFAPAALITGTLAASQAINALLGKEFASAPQAIFIDVFSKEVCLIKKLG